MSHHTVTAPPNFLFEIPRRVALACSACRGRKIKCITESQDRKCMRCHFNGFECEYVETEKQRERTSAKTKSAARTNAAGTSSARRKRASPYMPADKSPRTNSYSPLATARASSSTGTLSAVSPFDLDLDYDYFAPRLSSPLSSASTSASSSAASPLSHYGTLPGPYAPPLSTVDTFCGDCHDEYQSSFECAQMCACPSPSPSSSTSPHTPASMEFKFPTLLYSTAEQCVPADMDYSSWMMNNALLYAEPQIAPFSVHKQQHKHIPTFPVDCSPHGHMDDLEFYTSLSECTS